MTPETRKTLVATVMTAVVAFDAVGAILVITLFIVPAATGAATGAAPAAAPVDAAQPVKAAAHGCKGMNACAGQGGCKTGDNGCKGKNSCKGHGGCATNGVM